MHESLENVLADVGTDLPRASQHAVRMSVGVRLEHFADAPQHVYDAVASLPDGEYLTRAEVCRRLTGLDPQSRTAVVFLWGGSRGRHHTLAAMNEPRPNSRGWSDAAAANAGLWEIGRSSSPCEAFAALWADDSTKAVLHGCGTSFGTKLLHFAARCDRGYEARDAGPVPLIYDVRVHASLQHIKRREHRLPTFTHPQKRMKFATYEQYCDLTFRWAEALNGCAPGDTGRPFLADDVELWLFRGFRQRPVPNGGEPVMSTDEAGGGLEDESSDLPEDDPPTEAEDQAMERILTVLAHHLPEPEW